MTNKDYLREKRKDLRWTLYHGSKHRAKKNGIEFSISFEDIIVPEFCPIFGFKLKQGNGKTEPHSPTLDRIDPKKGYIKGNIWVISHKANKIKNDSSIEDLHILGQKLKQFLPIKIVKDENFSDKHILVIGENCKDGWIEGTVRLNPEAPCCVVLPINEKYNSGMAGNVVSNIKSLSSNKVTFITQSNLISKTRYLDSKSNYIIVRVDTLDKAEALTKENFLKNVENVNFDAVIISDYNKGFLTIDMIEYINEYFDQKNIPVFIDSKKILGSWSKKAFVIKINELEYNNNKEELIDVSKYCKNLIVTKGKNGSWLANEDHYVQAKGDFIANVCGCGDTYLAALVVSYLDNKDLKIAMDFASYASSYVATKRDVYSPTKEEINVFITENP